MSEEEKAKLMEILGGKSRRRWSVVIKEAITYLEGLEEPKDRLEATSVTFASLQNITMTVKGWNQWFTNIHPLKELDEAEWKQIAEILKASALTLLELDLLITKKVEKIYEEKIRKHKTKDKEIKPSKKDKSEKYVA